MTALLFVGHWTLVNEVIWDCLLSGPACFASSRRTCGYPSLLSFASLCPLAATWLDLSPQLGGSFRRRPHAAFIQPCHEPGGSTEAPTSRLGNLRRQQMQICLTTLEIISRKARGSKGFTWGSWPLAQYNPERSTHLTIKPTSRFTLNPIVYSDSWLCGDSSQGRRHALVGSAMEAPLAEKDLQPLASRELGLPEPCHR